MPILRAITLKTKSSLLIRARHVLVYLLHFFAHSLPEAERPAIIPAPLAVPLLVVSRTLDVPPALTYADTEYYNFDTNVARGNSAPGAQEPDADPMSLSINILNTFSGTSDEKHFYITSLRIE